MLDIYTSLRWFQFRLLCEALAKIYGCDLKLRNDQSSNQLYLAEVIQWVSRIGHFNVPIVERRLLSAHKIRSFMLPRASLMIPNDVLTVVRNGNRTDRGRDVIRDHVRCFRQFAVSAARAQKFHLNHVRESLFIVAIVIPK